MDTSAFVPVVAGVLMVAWQSVDAFRKWKSGRTAAERAAAKSVTESLTLAESRARWDSALARIWAGYAVELRAWCLNHHGEPQPPPPMPIPEQTLGPRP